MECGLTHGRESVEEAGDVGHHTFFIWPLRVAQILDFQQLWDVQVVSSNFESQSRIAMSIALRRCQHQTSLVEQTQSGTPCLICHSPEDRDDGSG